MPFTLALVKPGGRFTSSGSGCRVPKGEDAVVITFPPMPQTADREPIYKFTEEQVAAKSALARQFIESRRKLNANVEKADNYPVKRFYNLDHNTYLEGAIPAKYKELMGLVVSAGLRCDDCINYHIIQSYRLEASRAEQEEALNVGLGSGRQHCDPALEAGVRDAGGTVRLRSMALYEMPSAASRSA
jgi:AhpD family alkylhydroperoxidase